MPVEIADIYTMALVRGGLIMEAMPVTRPYAAQSLSRRIRRRRGLRPRPPGRARAGASKPARTSAPSTPAVGSASTAFALGQMRRATPLLLTLIQRSAGSTLEDVSHGYAPGKAAA
jgi:hypothetical protein